MVFTFINLAILEIVAKQLEDISIHLVLIMEDQIIQQDISNDCLFI